MHVFFSLLFSHILLLFLTFYFYNCICIYLLPIFFYNFLYQFLNLFIENTSLPATQDPQVYILYYYSIFCMFFFFLFLSFSFIFFIF